MGQDSVRSQSVHLQDWLSEATAAIKALDTNHLTLLDSEGGWGDSTPRELGLHALPVQATCEAAKGYAMFLGSCSHQ